MAENSEKNEDNINSLCKKYFTPELRAGLSRKDERTLQLKLIRQMEAFANDLWKKSNYKKLNLQKNEKNDVVTKVEAKDSAIALCFSSWKKNPLQNTNGYAKFFETTFINELHKFVDEDLKNFTYVPEKVTENDRLLCDKCKSRGIANDDLSGQKKIAHEIGLSDDEYEAVRKWRLSKNLGSLEIPIGDDEKGELKDNLEDERTQSPDNKYIEIETGNVPTGGNPLSRLSSMNCCIDILHCLKTRLLICTVLLIKLFTSCRIDRRKKKLQIFLGRMKGNYQELLTSFWHYAWRICQISKHSKMITNCKNR